MQNMLDVSQDESSFDYKIYKKLFRVPVILNGAELFIKKAQFFTELNFKGCCEVKIDGKWYATTRETILKGLKEYNRQKRLEAK